MAIATPPQRMGPGVEEHELIALVEAHLAIIALARPMRLKSSWAGKMPASAHSSARGLIFASMNFFVTGMPLCSRRESHRYLP